MSQASSVSSFLANSTLKANSFSPFLASQSTSALSLGVSIVILITLSLIYNDRLLFVATRSELSSPKAYLSIGSTPWLMTVANKKPVYLSLAVDLFTSTILPTLIGFKYQVWKAQRKLASNIFFVLNFRNHVQETVHGDLTTLNSLMTNLVEKGQEVNLQDIFFSFNLSSFATMAFSTTVGCLPSDPVQLAPSGPFADAFDFAQLVMDSRLSNPMAKLIEMWSTEGREMRKATKFLEDYCYDLIDAKTKRNAQLLASGEAYGRNEGNLRKDLLDLFMEKGGEREELRICVINFLIAGRDTTAQTLGWGFYELFLNPEVIPKIREKIDSVLEGRMMDHDDIKSLPYLQGVFYEATRLHPAVARNIKKALKDDIIKPYQQKGFDMSKSTMVEEGGLQDRLPDIGVKAGETVSWSDYVMTRTPEVWGPDCCKFKPERFIEEKS